MRRHLSMFVLSETIGHVSLNSRKRICRVLGHTGPLEAQTGSLHQGGIPGKSGEAILAVFRFVWTVKREGNIIHYAMQAMGRLVPR